MVLYTLADDDPKASTAETLLTVGGVVSVQVLNGIAHVAHRKGGHGWPRVRELVDLVCARCLVVPLDVSLHFSALALADRYGFTIFDANIWAAAHQAGCDIIYSEDMQHGQTIAGTQLVNPFV